MNQNKIQASLRWPVGLCVLAGLLLSSCSPKVMESPSQLVQIGSMHQAIGQRQHQGRAALSEIVHTPHFYGVGALAALKGEITIIDSTPIVTSIGTDGKPLPADGALGEATMLVGQSVRDWKSTRVIQEVSYADFDTAIAQLASTGGVDISKPFVFVVDGEFLDARVHIINGACPVHARMKNLIIESDKQPYEIERQGLSGKIVGIYAPDSVGKLTHPATSTHAHLIYAESDGSAQLTGHIERIGIAKGSTVSFPAMN